ncbi:MAG TPA: monooxygenase, partial [Polymorphobacter sp.]|nr:monooxygenase [Polymorphobacter sp.]
PGIPGIDTFKGHSFHTSRWDYDYTGGDTFGAPLDKLKDKRVAIIGTGATAVQCVPHLARAGGTVYVVQRTPSSIDVRANEPIDPEWFKTVATPGWQKRWLDNFARNVGMGGAAEDWVKDGWTDLTRRIRAKVMNLPPEQMNPAGMMAAYEDADIEKMSEIRARAEAIVEDKDTAEKLKAWYRQLCKRPCFHDAYLQAFNEPNTHLIDTDGKGVERIDETGFWVGGKHYDVDCIIYASGFEVGTSHQRRAGFDIAGVGGKRLSEAWGDGMRTLHGLHVNGFPNAFVVQVAQAANYIVNVPHNWSDAGETIATIVRHAIDTGAKKVDVIPEAQKKWVEFVLTSPGGMAGIAPDCTPGYYNNEGKGYQESALFGAGHPAGAVAFFSYIDDWRKSGKFEGLAFN